MSSPATRPPYEPAACLGTEDRADTGRGPPCGGTVRRVPTEPARAPTMVADAVAFPELTDEQLAIVRDLGSRRTVAAGDVLYSPADDAYDFVVMLSATIDVLGPDGVLITSHGPRRFLGEVSLVTRQRPYLTTKVVASGDIVVIAAEVFRSRVLTDPRLSDTVLEAFLARRTALLSAAATTLQIVGSPYTPASMALREYAARNRLPHQWIDADHDDGVATLLDRLGVTAPTCRSPSRHGGC